MKHEIMGASHWGPIINSRMQTAAQDSHLGLATLRLLHSNGLGLPVETAFSFAAWLQGRGTEGHYWANAFQQLFSGMDLRRMHCSVSMLERSLQKKPFQAVRLFLFPVVRRVLATIKTNLVFSTTDRQSNHAHGDYQNYAEAFQSILASLLPDTSQIPTKTANDEGAVAWRRALALRLVQFTHLLDDPDDHEEWSMPDILAAEWFLAASRRQYASGPDRALPQLAREGTVRRSSRNQQGGIAGVRHASPGQDPSTMLQHQMVNAFEVLVEQIENEGFIAYDRPPPLPDKKRYIFVALSAEVKESPALSLTRAAWWLACQRLEVALCDQEMSIDFAWLPTAAGRPARGSFVRSPEKFSRIRSSDTSENYLARCPGLGAPFRVGQTRLPGQLLRSKVHWPSSAIETLSEAGIQVVKKSDSRVSVFILAVNEVKTDATHEAIHIKQWRDEFAGEAADDPVIISAQIVSGSPESGQSIAFEAQDPVNVGADFEGGAGRTLEVADFLIEEMMKVVRNE